MSDQAVSAAPSPDATVGSPPEAKSASPAPKEGLPGALTEVLEERLAQAEELLPLALRAEEEAVHDLRVCLRRIRVLSRELSEGRGKTGGPLAELAAGATALFRALGGLRDLDIVSRELKELIRAGQLADPVHPQISAWLEEERGRLRLGLGDAATLFQSEVARHCGGGPESSQARRSSAASRRRALRRRAKRLLKALERVRGEPSDETLHRMRIRGKQLRYTLEAFSPTSVEGGEQLESRLKKVQDALGSIQDAAMVVARLDALAAGGVLSAAAAGPPRMAAANERDRRRQQFLSQLQAGDFANLLDEVRSVAAKQGDGTSSGSNGSADGDSTKGQGQADPISLENIPGIGAAKARRLADAGLSTPQALKAASVDEVAAVKTIGTHQARLIKEFVDRGSAGDEEPTPEDLDGKRFERSQSVIALAAVVADYASTLGEELSRQEEGDAVRAARQAERLVEGLKGLQDRLGGISTKKLKGLRGELREAEGLLAKVLDLDSSSLKMNKVRRALKAHRKGIESYLA